MHRVLTTCPHCSCGCGLYLLVDRGEVIGVMPSVGHPVSRGSLCIKGWMSFQHIHRAERLAFPRIRRNGTLKRASWEEALAYVGEGLDAVRLRHGSQMIGVWASGRATNEELFLLRRIADQGLETKAVRFDSSLHALDHIPGPLVEGPRAARFDEIQAADLLIIFGQGFPEHHPQVASRILRAMDRGAKGVVISPYRDLLAARATLYLQAPFPEEIASALTNGEAGSSGRLRTLWAEAARPMLIYPLKSLPLVREAELLRAFERLLAKTWATVLLLFPRANSRGAFLRRTGTANPEASGLKALIVVEEDPAAWSRNFRDIARDLDLLVVQDLFPTETAELAHVVLPGASFAEKGGTLTNTEGRQQELRPAVLSPGDARPGWAILAELARRLGISAVGSTLQEIQQSMASEQVERAPADLPLGPASPAAASFFSMQHVPDRLGWMWLKDPVLRHTDDWQREHQDRWLEVHPEDAKALGLRSGWTVRVAGDGDEFTAMLRISDRVGRGVLYTPCTPFEGPIQIERVA